MQRRDPLMVAVLSIVTLGIYALVWYVKTKREMNTQGAQIPTAWLIIIPIVNIYWLWKFSEGVETVTKGGLSGAVAFLLLILLSYMSCILMVGLRFIRNAQATPEMLLFWVPPPAEAALFLLPPF